LKTPNKIAMLAVPVGLVAALMTATGALAQSPAQHAAAAAPASVVSTANATTTPAQTADTETLDNTAAPEIDVAGGHVDNPSDPNADHQFDGEE